MTKVSILVFILSLCFCGCIKVPLHSGSEPAPELAFPADLFDYPVLVMEQSFEFKDVPYLTHEQLEEQKALRARFINSKGGRRKLDREISRSLMTKKALRIAKRRKLNITWVHYNELEQYPDSTYRYIILRVPFYRGNVYGSLPGDPHQASGTALSKDFFYHVYDRQSEIHYQDMTKGSVPKMLRRTADARKHLKQQAKEFGLTIESASADSSFVTLMTKDTKLFGLSHEDRRKVPLKLLKILGVSVATVAVNLGLAVLIGEMLSSL